MTVAAVAVAASIAVVFTLGSSGLGYLWCAPMQEARSHCCCPAPSPEEAAHDRIGVQCCELRHMGTLASGVTHGVDHAVIASPLLAILPLADLFRAPVLAPSVLPGHAREARAGPGRRPHAIHSVYLI